MSHVSDLLSLLCFVFSSCAPLLESLLMLLFPKTVSVSRRGQLKKKRSPVSRVNKKAAWIPAHKASMLWGGVESKNFDKTSRGQ